ncbi:hypothetical protein GCM10010123_46370 [Pilimelia anulata]|uniref:Uncharacterized protein n=1 Tax=Pilimelia anulata TaxID=53371 RepID=A0A8J3BHV5_9ACTN|nr:hypothetical protein GCM10010123_46370 [Pilimelia anulata]
MAEQLDRGIELWVAKGTAWRFEHARPPGPCTLVELASQALDMVRTPVKTYWLDRVDNLDPSDVADITAQMPGMSEVASTFFQRVVEANRRRVLDDC